LRVAQDVGRDDVQLQPAVQAGRDAEFNLVQRPVVLQLVHQRDGAALEILAAQTGRIAAVLVGRLQIELERPVLVHRRGDVRDLRRQHGRRHQQQRDHPRESHLVAA